MRHCLAFLRSPSHTSTITCSTLTVTNRENYKEIVIFTLTSSLQLTFSCSLMYSSRLVSVSTDSGLKRNLEHREVSGSIMRLM